MSPGLPGVKVNAPKLKPADVAVVVAVLLTVDGAEMEVPIVKLGFVVVVTALKTEFTVVVAVVDCTAAEVGLKKNPEVGLVWVADAAAVVVTPEGLNMNPAEGSLVLDADVVVAPNLNP